MPRPLDAVEAEATGQPYVTALYKGREYKLPTDGDDWPLDSVAVSVGVNAEGKLLPNHAVLADALMRLLGDQWTDFINAFPRRRELLPASRAFAAAAGFAGDTRDLSFGSLPRLLAVLTRWGDAVEASLGELGIDYRDRWRLDADGRRRLTLRQIHVRLAHLPLHSALNIAMNGGRAPHSATDLLLMDVYEAIARVPHPSRPMTPDQAKARDEKKAKKDKALDDYRKRHPDKSRKQTAVDIARANAQPRKKAAQHADAQEDQHHY